MIKKNDISTPEGYFEDLRIRLSDIARGQDGAGTSLPWPRRLVPYAAIAASMVLAVTVGNFILRKTVRPAGEDNWEYISYLAEAMDPDGVLLLDTSTAAETLSEDDIIHFLIDDGISVEHLNYVNYEEGY